LNVANVVLYPPIHSIIHSYTQSWVKRTFIERWLEGIGHKSKSKILLATPTRRQALVSLVLYTASVLRFPLAATNSKGPESFRFQGLLIGAARGNRTLQVQYPNWPDCSFHSNLAQSGFDSTEISSQLISSLPHQQKRPRRAFFVVVRPEGIEPSTNPWQGLIIPLNHGRSFIYLVL
jgi:hypothetical protein